MERRKWILIATVGAFLIFLTWFLYMNFTGKMIVNPFIIRFGRFGIKWYSVLIASGILIDYIIAKKYFKKRGWKTEELDEALLFGVVLGIIFARAYYVIFQWDYFKNHPSEIYKTWHGGIAIHGGILGAILAVWLYTRKKRSFNFFEGLDVASWLFPLAQGIGRWGNFFNHEAYGTPTNLPWKMFVPLAYRMPGYENYSYFHPTFLYESVWDISSFVLLSFYVKNCYKKPGEITALYLVLYSLGRIMVEGLRLDSLYLGHIRVAQLFSAIAMVIGGLWYLKIVKRDECSNN